MSGFIINIIENIIHVYYRANIRDLAFSKPLSDDNRKAVIKMFSSIKFDFDFSGDSVVSVSV